MVALERVCERETETDRERQREREREREQHPSQAPRRERGQTTPLPAESAFERENVCVRVCVCVCARERETDRQRESESAGEIKRERVCVKERGRGGCRAGNRRPLATNSPNKNDFFSSLFWFRAELNYWTQNDARPEKVSFGKNQIFETPARSRPRQRPFYRIGATLILSGTELESLLTRSLARGFPPILSNGSSSEGGWVHSSPRRR